MCIHRSILALPALALAASLAVAGPWRSADPLPGDYANASNGGGCVVSRVGAEYIFTNEKGDSGRFRFIGPNRLGLVAGRGWDPDIVATIGPNRRGWTEIRFDAPWTAPGWWVPVG